MDLINTFIGNWLIYSWLIICIMNNCSIHEGCDAIKDIIS